MKNKKIPMRTCVVTHEKLEKKDLIRIVRNKDNQIIIDESGKLNGRGAYLKKDIKIVEQAKASKILEKHLEITIPDEIYEKLKEIV